MEPSVFRPTTEVRLGQESVAVRELAWPDAFEFLGRLSRHAGQLLDAQGKLTFTFDKLADLVSQTQELSEFLLLKSTGRDQTWLRGLPFSQGLELLAVALEVNLTEDLLKNGVRLGEQFKRLFGRTSPIGSLPS